MRGRRIVKASSSRFSEVVSDSGGDDGTDASLVGSETESERIDEAEELGSSTNDSEAGGDEDWMSVASVVN